MKRRSRSKNGTAYITMTDVTLQAVGGLAITLTTMMPKQFEALVRDNNLPGFVQSIDPKEHAAIALALESETAARLAAESEAEKQKSELEKALEKTEAVQNALSDSIRRAKSAESGNRVLQQNLDDAIANHEKSKTQAKRLETEKEHLRSQFASLQADHRNAVSRTNSIARELSEAKQETDQIEKRLSSELLVMTNSRDYYRRRAESDGSLTTQVASLKQDNEQQSSQIKSFQETISNLRDGLRKKNETLALMEAGKPIELLVYVDMTQSMHEPWKQLDSATRFIVQFMPRVCPHFRMRVCGYRRDIVMDTGWMDVTLNRSSHQDAITKVNQVLSRHTNVISEANMDLALTQGMEILDGHDDLFGDSKSGAGLEQRQILAVLADVGPFEMDETLGVSHDEIKRGKELISQVSDWAQRGSDRRIMTLYADSEYTAQDPDRSASIGFFERLGTTNSSSVFCMDSSQLLSALLEACFAPSKRSPAKAAAVNAMLPNARRSILGDPTINLQ